MDINKLDIIEEIALESFSIYGKGIVNAFTEDSGHEHIGKKLIIEVENDNTVVMIKKIEEFHRKTSDIVDYKFGWTDTMIHLSNDSKLNLVFVVNDF